MNSRNTRKITADERNELREAILRGKIGNATAFAEAYGSEHGLNPSTVRTTISRLRHELGALERPPREAGDGTATGAGRVGWVARILLAAPEGELAWVGAAALVRYEADAAFKSAVDQRKAEVVEVYSALEVLRAKVPEGARAELMYAFLDSAAFDSAPE